MLLTYKSRLALKAYPTPPNRIQNLRPGASHQKFGRIRVPCDGPRGSYGCLADFVPKGIRANQDPWLQ
eukprot:1962279-Rhodomonas_salina.2